MTTFDEGKVKAAISRLASLTNFSFRDDVVVDDVPTEKRDTEVIGWRGWSLVEPKGDPHLVSATNNVSWQGPALTADIVPEINRPHGIYSYKPEHKPEAGQYGFVYGEVALSGRVIECEKGYRAERAVIRSLHIRPPQVASVLEGVDLDQLAQKLAIRYGVEVELDPWSAEQRHLYHHDLLIRNRRRTAHQNLVAAMKEYHAVSDRSGADLCVALTDMGGSTHMMVGRVERVSRQAYGSGGQDFYNHPYMSSPGNYGMEIRIEALITGHYPI